MNLKELKAMIAEEYSNYLAEQDEPTVAVSDADVDADGDEDAEETLRDIFNMLKNYFEGDDEGAGGAGDDADEIEEGMHDEDDKNEGKKDKEDLQERFKKLANIIKG
jgi:hypothetical protein